MTLSTRHESRVAPVRDGTCDDCAGCDCAPPPPCDEGVEGGQGRDDLSMVVASDVVAWCIVAAMVLGLIVYACFAAGGAS